MLSCEASILVEIWVKIELSPKIMDEFGENRVS